MHRVYIDGRTLAMAAIRGADGLIIEVHNDPKNALCDGAQSLTYKSLRKLWTNYVP